MTATTKAVLGAALAYTPIAPDPDRACPCNPNRRTNPDMCGCPGFVPISGCRCYGHILLDPALWDTWPWKEEVAGFGTPPGTVDLVEARRRSQIVVDYARGTML